MYSLGVVVWECLTQEIPHEGQQVNTIILRAMSLQDDDTMLPIPAYPLQSLSSEDQSAWKVLCSIASCCLSRDRGKRLTATDVVKAMNDPSALLGNSKGKY